MLMMMMMMMKPRPARGVVRAENHIYLRLPFLFWVFLTPSHLSHPHQTLSSHTSSSSSSQFRLLELDGGGVLRSLRDDGGALGPLPLVRPGTGRRGGVLRDSIQSRSSSL
mmetsp:Transcript_31440/g.91450  ORF Transcript_31440/g.91450 Transcript_31440/m.91450 type:complete len:110 (-) Transcript_31440:900-1229(-)